MYRSTGTIRYSPKGGGGVTSAKWWMILDACEDLSRYYRHWYNVEFRYSHVPLIHPGWTSHISVVCDEVPPHAELWFKYDRQEFEFEYGNDIYGNGDFHWIDVICDPLLDIREELGLPREPEYPLHLTIGRTVR